jgi:uncharacterized protein YcbK (DUF882 family)
VSAYPSGGLKETAGDSEALMNRRLFLSLAAALATAPLRARAVARSPALRRLRLVNPHTGETFEGTYRDDKGPIDRVMEDLCVFLRDHYSGEKTQMDVGVIDFLADIMSAVGETRATVLSAYRTPETNAALARTTFGVAENSQHLYGRALDIHLGSRLTDAMTAARAMMRGGVGWYPHSGFLHIDSGPVRNWTLEESGLGDLLDGERISHNAGAPGRLAGASKLPVVPPGGAPSTLAQHYSRLYQVARSEFLAHLR